MSAVDQEAPISTEDLRKLVDAVTPGKWRKHGNGQQIVGGKEGQIIATMIYGGVSKANSRLIALAPELAAEVLARRADLATEPGTTALAEMLDAETRACAEVVRSAIPNIPPDGPTNDECRIVYEELGGAMTAILARLDQRKEAGE